MKKNTLYKVYLIAILLSQIISYSQNLQPFSPRYQGSVKGDILMIGNNILNRNSGVDVPTVPYNGTSMNHNFNMEYIDIDSDVTTFNSSSATLNFPTTSCNRIVYAGLYWSAILQNGSRADINKVKLQLPTNGYNDIVGQVIYDADVTPLGTENSRPYVCYADVTSLLSGLTNAVGTYTIANVLSSQGSLGVAGLSAGWTLFIVYENQSMVKKSITTLDGFTALINNSTYDISMSGLSIPPFGPVKARFAMAALEGDISITGDYLKINNASMSTPQRPTTNFFNSSITVPNITFTDRIPNGSNTLGLDTAVFNIPNPGNSIVPNSGNTLTVSLGNSADNYFYFFNAFAFDLTEPNIVLTTNVIDNTNNSVNGTNVSLGQEVNYLIGFQNIGNENVTSLTIRANIPQNIITNPSDLILPSGVSYSYNPVTSSYIFTIPNNLVEVGDPAYYIQIKERIPSTCENFTTACSSTIQNQAYATYSGSINVSSHVDEPSYSSLDVCGVGSATPSTFGVSLTGCDFTKEIIMCGNTYQLQAANGYDNYIWSGPGTINPVPGTNNQQVDVLQPGIYTVSDVFNSSDCPSINETFNVIVCNPSNIVYANANRLYSSITNASNYQWINCDNGNQDIFGENNQYFEPSVSGNYALRLTMPNGYVITSDCTPFTVLGIKSFEKSDFKIYPNPINDRFSISLESDIEKLSIYNTIGQEIDIFTNNSKEYSIGKLQSGTYILKIQTKSGLYTTKIIKQ